jgi:hypothetical protein
VTFGAFQQHRLQLNLCVCPQSASASVCAGNLPASISVYAMEASFQFKAHLGATTRACCPKISTAHRNVIQSSLSAHRDQRADCCAARAFGRPFTRSTMPVPLRKTARSSRAAMDLPQQRRASVCGSAAALRSDSVPAVSPSPLHCFRSPTADRSLSLIFLAPFGAVPQSAPTIRGCGQPPPPVQLPSAKR